MVGPTSDGDRLEVLGGPDDERPRSSVLATPQGRVQFDAGVAAGSVPDVIVLTHAHRNRVCGLDAVGDAVVIETVGTRALRLAFPGAYTGSTQLVGLGRTDPATVGGHRLTLLESGHLPGSVAVLVDDGEQRSVWAGDLGWRDRAALRGVRDSMAWHALEPDVVYLEWPVLDDDPLVDEDVGLGLLIAEVDEALADGGRVLIAAAACGRGQHVLADLGAAMRAGRLPSLPVGVDLLTGAVADAWPGGIDCPRTGDLDSARVMVLSTRLLFPGSPSAEMAHHLKGDPRSRVVIAGGVVNGSPAETLLRRSVRDGSPGCRVSQIPFCDRLTRGDLAAFEAWVGPRSIQWVGTGTPVHSYMAVSGRAVRP